MNRFLLLGISGEGVCAFARAAEGLGASLVAIHEASDATSDQASVTATRVSFDVPDRASQEVLEGLSGEALQGVLAYGHRAAAVAALVAHARGLEWHPFEGVQAAADALLARGRWIALGLPTAWFAGVPSGSPLDTVADRLRLPCVVKAAIGRGAMGTQRADSFDACARALERLRERLEHLGPTGPPHHMCDAIVEGLVPGAEFALDGIMVRGVLHVLAIWENWGAEDAGWSGEPTFVTPPLLSAERQRLMAGVIAHAVLALGLGHGPVSATCRVNDEGIFVLDVVPWVANGARARALRFVDDRGSSVSLEELLLRQASGESLDVYAREGRAAGVLWLAAPTAGRLRWLGGIDAALRVQHIDQVIVTAQPGQLIEPSRSARAAAGAIVARAPDTDSAVRALIEASRAVTWTIDAVPPQE